MALAALLWCAQSWGQVCCVGGGAIEPARLMLHERGLVALQLQGGVGVGSLSRDGAWVQPPEGTQALQLQQSLIGTVRLFRRAQLSLTVPLVENLRRAGALAAAEQGAGLGDVSLSGRWDFIHPGESSRLPGIAVEVGTVLPTGRALEAARLPLGSDATGAGAVQALAGVSAEEVFGRFVLSGRLLGAVALPRRVYGMEVQPGPELTAMLAGGWSPDEASELALVLSTARAAETRIGGAVAKGSGRALTRVALSGARELVQGWRLNAAVTSDLPWLGHNRELAAGFSLMMVRSFD